MYIGIIPCFFQISFTNYNISFPNYCIFVFIIPFLFQPVNELFVNNLSMNFRSFVNKANFVLFHPALLTYNRRIITEERVNFIWQKKIPETQKDAL